MKTYLMAGVAAAALAIPTATVAQRHEVETTDLVNVNVGARFDWNQTSRDGHNESSESGFMADYLRLRLDGQIIPGLTYSWRQRFNKAHADGYILDATDWLFLAWQYGNLHLSAGKETVLIGSSEYDRNPMDVFVFSDFVYNIACFQLAATVGYDLSKSDRLSLQLSQSPFSSKDLRNLYSTNLYWAGSHGIWSTLWSANMAQYAPGRWINYIALGNRFDFNPVWFELDLMNRASSHGAFFGDHSIVANLGYDINSRWTIHAKFSYDRNKENTADLCVAPGTDLKMGGAGVEFYPIRRDNHRLRLHADCYYSWGDNGNSADLMQNKTLRWGAGVTWEMDLFSIKAKQTK